MPTCSENANTNNFFDLLDNGIKILIFSYLWMSLLEFELERNCINAIIDYKGLRCIRWLSYLLKIKHNKINIPLQIDNKYKIGDIPDILAFFWNKIKNIEDLITICKKEVLDKENNGPISVYDSSYVICSLYLYSKKLKELNNVDLKYVDDRGGAGTVFMILNYARYEAMADVYNKGKYIDTCAINLSYLSILFAFDNDFYDYINNLKN